jgi:hypothetical protein
MSSYSRPSQRQAYNWREREAEAKRKQAEEDQRKRNVMNESNFPTLTSVKPNTAAVGSKYAELAEQWSTDDTVDKQMERHKKFNEEVERQTERTIASHRTHHTTSFRRDEEYEEDMSEQAPNSLLNADSGWNEVKHKHRKHKRELTIEEMDAIDEDMRAQENANEFNAHLFDSKRHDHDRV